MDQDSTVWRCDDKAVLQAARKMMLREQDVLNLAVLEALAGWDRLPLVADHWTHREVLGIARHPKDQEPSQPGFKISEIPEGWRKNVKNSYLTPIYRGGGKSAQMARDYIERYKHISSCREFIEAEYGASAIYFSGLSIVTFGIDFINGALYLSGGKQWEVKDKRFHQIKLSEYLALKGK